VNKQELSQKLAKEGGISKNAAAAAVNLFFGQISDALAEGDRVEIRRLFSFFVKNYDPYKGRNPKTGESVNVPRKKLPFFRCGQDLKELIDH
jgi:integration host factor subunit beta